MINLNLPRRPQSPLKRALDVTLATLGLICSAPLWIVIMIVIKRDDGGPLFHHELRWGYGGVAFRILKFRTFALDPQQPGVVFSPTGERCFSRAGALLRARGFDELPQLINILRGEMSFVGPRPLAIEELPLHQKPELIADPALAGFAVRLSVLPGLTGLAQIYGSKYLTHRQKFRYDTLYIQKQSLWLDLYLLVVSLWVSLRGRWEITGKKLA